jgi:hypothetical protein
MQEAKPASVTAQTDCPQGEDALQSPLFVHVCTPFAFEHCVCPGAQSAQWPATHAWPSQGTGVPQTPAVHV